jgi:hypothetical protein
MSGSISGIESLGFADEGVHELITEFFIFKTTPQIPCLECVAGFFEYSLGGFFFNNNRPMGSTGWLTECGASWARQRGSSFGFTPDDHGTGPVLRLGVVRSKASSSLRTGHLRSWFLPMSRMETGSLIHARAPRSLCGISTPTGRMLSPEVYILTEWDSRGSENHRRRLRKLLVVCGRRV